MFSGKILSRSVGKHRVTLCCAVSDDNVFVTYTTSLYALFQFSKDSKLMRRAEAEGTEDGLSYNPEDCIDITEVFVSSSLDNSVSIFSNDHTSLNVSVLNSNTPNSVIVLIISTSTREFLSSCVTY